jgi:hypothetical protein
VPLLEERHCEYCDTDFLPSALLRAVIKRYPRGQQPAFS